MSFVVVLIKYVIFIPAALPISTEVLFLSPIYRNMHAHTYFCIILSAFLNHTFRSSVSISAFTQLFYFNV